MGLKFDTAGKLSMDEALLEQLEQAVKDAIGVNERVGAHLSGGLDSSTIALLAARSRPNKSFRAYTWQPLAANGEGKTADQLIVRKVSERGQMLLRPSPPTVDDVLAYLALDPCNCSVTSTLLHEASVQRGSGERRCNGSIVGLGRRPGSDIRRSS